MVDKAIEGWTNATKLDPTLAFPWINLAFQLEYLGKNVSNDNLGEEGYFVSFFCIIDIYIYIYIVTLFRICHC